MATSGLDSAEVVVPGSRFFLIGTIVWAVLVIALLPFAGRLSDEGRTWWLWAALAGVGIGLIGLEVTRRRARSHPGS